MLLICALISCNQKHYGFREKIKVGSKTVIATTTTTKQTEIKLIQYQSVKTVSSSVIVADIPALQPIKVSDKKAVFQKKLKLGKIKILESTHTDLSENKENILQDSGWDWGQTLVHLVFFIALLGIAFLLWSFLFSSFLLFLGIILSVVLACLLIWLIILILWFVWTLIFGP